MTTSGKHFGSVGVAGSRHILVLPDKDPVRYLSDHLCASVCIRGSNYFLFVRLQDVQV